MVEYYSTTHYTNSVEWVELMNLMWKCEHNLEIVHISTWQFAFFKKFPGWKQNFTPS